MKQLTVEDKQRIDYLVKGLGVSQIKTSKALDIPKSTVNDYILGKTHKQKQYRWQTDPIDINPNDVVVGVIPDLHAPAQHEDTLEFLIDVFDRKGVNTIVCLGDLIDNHKSSRYVDEQDALNFVDEYKATREFIEDFKGIFPYGKLCIGNHCQRISSRAKSNNIDMQSLKSLGEYIGLHTDHNDTSWTIENSFIINGVKYVHKSRNGIHGVYNASKEFGGSIVSGHTHINLGIRYLKNMHGVYFACDAGCMIDKQHYSMRYGEKYSGELSLGCAVVYSSSYAEVIPYI